MVRSSIGLLAVVVLLYAPCAAKGSILPLFDNFDDRDLTGVPPTWFSTVPGAVSAQTGDLVISHNTLAAAVVVESPNSDDDLVIRTTLRFLEASNDDTIASIFARSLDLSSSYYGGIAATGDLFIGQSDSDGISEPDNVDHIASSLDPLTSDIALEFTVTDGQFGVESSLTLTAWEAGTPKPDVPQLVRGSNPFLTKGAFGLNVNTRETAPYRVAFLDFIVVPEPASAALVGGLLAGLSWRPRVNTAV